MSTRPRLAIVIGSTRPGRHAEIVARWVHDLAGGHDDATVELVDLAEHVLPMYDEPVPPMAGCYTHPHTHRWAETVAAFDGFAFVTPEYNHAPPAVLKNALDYLFAEWNDKACGFISYGMTGGGVRAVEHLRLVAAELRMADVRSQVTLSLADDWTNHPDPTTFSPRHFQAGNVHTTIDQITAWARALRTLRNPAA